MNPELDELNARVRHLEKQVIQLDHQKGGGSSYGVGRRARSKTTIFGIPLWEIAIGPNPDRGECCGHAKAIFALGDVATGLFALGGIARGLFALGGVAIGGVSLGGVSLGLLLSLGGVAIGGCAIGGAAIGIVAIGGAAVGVIAIGGASIGSMINIGPLAALLGPPSA